MIALGSSGGLGSYNCTASQGLAYAREYCGTCPETGEFGPCPIEDPLERPLKGGGPNCHNEGNPCSPSTGNKYQETTDYRSAGGYLELTRAYNSLAAERNGSIGFGWTLSSSRSIRVQSATKLLVKQATGRSEPWTLIDGKWKGDADSRLRLISTPEGFEVTTSDSQIEYYNKQGLLVRVADTLGLQTLFSYTNGGILDRITDPFGRTLEFEYGTGDNSTRIVQVMTPEGAIKYDYDNLGNLATVTNVDGSLLTYHYEIPAFPHHLTGLTDQLGVRFATWAYDPQGRAVRSEHADGANLTIFSFQTDGTTKVTGALGDERFYTFNQRHGVSLVSEIKGDRCAVCGTGALAKKSYDANGFLSSTTDSNGFQTTWLNNVRGLTVERTEAAGTPVARTVKYQWHPQFRKPTLIDEPKRTTSLTYTENGSVLTRTITDKATGEVRRTVNEYNEQNLLASINGPRTDLEDITRLSYDANGNLVEVSNALGQRTVFSDYTASGLAQQITGPSGIVIHLTYDAMQRITSVTVAVGTEDESTSHFRYDLAGQLISTKLGDGSSLYYQYDSAHRLTTVSDSAGNQMVFELDPAGNRLSTELRGSDGAIAYMRSAQYDMMSQLIELKGAQQQVTRFEYDAAGNKTQTTLPDQQVITSTFDALGRLISSVDPALGETSQGYNEHDQLTSVTDANGHQTTYTYNGFDELVSRKSPDAGTTNFSYDPAGNKIGQRDARGVEVRLSYDALNRLTQIKYPSSPGEDIRYSYDGDNLSDAHPAGIGKLTGLSDGSGSTAYLYDNRGNVIREIFRTEERVSHIDYRYDTANRLAGMTYPSGRVVNYRYNNVGQITEVTTRAQVGMPEQVVVRNIRYRPFGPVSSISFGNGLERQIEFDQDYQVRGIKSEVVDRAFGYDLSGNITQITDQLKPDYNQSFSYDQLSRLTSASGHYGSQTYSYDSVGNRTNRRKVAGTDILDETYTYAENNNNLLSVFAESDGSKTTRTLSYNAVGQTVKDTSGDRTLALIFNAANRVEQIEEDGKPLALYVYNALGQRVIKVATTPSANTHFHYDRNGLLIAESSPTGVLQREAIFLDGQPIALIVNRPVTQPLTITSQPASAAIAAGGSFSYQVSANSSNPSSLTYKLVGAPTGMTIDPATGLVKWQPTASQSGTFKVTVQVSDGSSTVDQVLELSVEAPAAEPISPTVTVNFDVNASSWKDSRFMTVSGEGRYKIDGGLKPAGFAQEHLAFTQVASGSVITSTITIGNGQVWHDKHGPAIWRADGSGVYAMKNGTTVTLHSFNGVNRTSLSSHTITAAVGDTLALALERATGKLTLTFNNKELRVVTNTSLQTGDLHLGMYMIWGNSNAASIRSWKGDGYAAGVVGTTPPTPVNNAPVINSTPVTAGKAQQAYAYDVKATDADNDALTFALVAAPAGMTLTQQSGQLRWTPTATQAGSHIVRLSLSDGKAIAEQSFTVVVEALPQTGKPAFQADATGMIVIEAENFHTRKAAYDGFQWDQIVHTAAVNGKAVQIPNGAGTAYPSGGYLADAARVDYRINFPSSGTYFIWARGNGLDGRSDSMHFGLNGVEDTKATAMSNFYPYNQWIWTNKQNATSAIIRITVPTAGVHTLNGWMREPRLILDRIILTKDSVFKPTGNGPAESKQQ